MIPSKKLRRIISERHKIELKGFFWDRYFERKVYNIHFKESKKDTTLKEVFYNGFNIGNCLITAYYVSSIIQNPSICTGEVEILKGTKNSTNGEHVWIETEESIIDTTLMIILPKSHPYSKYYKKDSTIVPMFSPTDLNYSNDYYAKEYNPDEYYSNLFIIK